MEALEMSAATPEPGSAEGAAGGPGRTGAAGTPDGAVGAFGTPVGRAGAPGKPDGAGGAENPESEGPALAVTDGKALGGGGAAVGRTPPAPGSAPGAGGAGALLSDVAL